MITSAMLPMCGADDFVNVFDFTPPAKVDACEVWTVKPKSKLFLPPEEPKAQISYPIRGSWWSVDHDWKPSRSKVLRHLRESPNHSKKKFQEWNLESLSFEELQSLHSDDHEGKVKEILVSVVKYVEKWKPKKKPEQACPT